jgi:hypothetical protein
VALVDGFASAYLRQGERELLVFESSADPAQSRRLREAARALIARAAGREEGRRGMLLSEINGVPAGSHSAAGILVDAGFSMTAMGLQARGQGAGSRT